MSTSDINYDLLLLPHIVQTAWSSSSFVALAAAFLSVAALGLWLAPGGLAWALLKAKSKIRGPHGWPVTGLLSVFTQATPHRALASLAERLGAKPLMAFSVGLTRFVISSQPETAKEILGSSAFADRPVKESAYELLFHRAMGFAPYGDYWRSLRRISATHLFSPKKIADFGGFRQRTGMKMAEQITGSMLNQGHVQVKNILHFGSLNNVMMTVFGRTYDFSGARDDEAAELEAMVAEGYELLGIFNWSDHFPLLARLDLQGVRRRCKTLVGKVNSFVGNIIKEHRDNQVGDDRVGDFVDVLLDLEKTDNTKLSESDMIAVLWEMIFRGTDTVAILLEWVLARMVLHPDIQSKVQAEIKSVAGDRPVTDSDIPRMPYLQAVVKETLRVHPPGPLLSWARLAIHDVHIGDALVPKGTTAMVNMWSITHDPAVWAQPEQYRPERFLDDDVPILGSDLRLAPFGAGRRVCPGKALGLASAHLWLAQLLQNFHWLPSDTHPVDLTEVLNLSMEMNTPLLCKAIPTTTA